MTDCTLCVLFIQTRHLVRQHVTAKGVVVLFLFSSVSPLQLLRTAHTQTRSQSPRPRDIFSPKQWALTWNHCTTLATSKCVYTVYKYSLSTAITLSSFWLLQRKHISALQNQVALFSFHMHSSQQLSKILAYSVPTNECTHKTLKNPRT